MNLDTDLKQDIIKAITPYIYSICEEKFLRVLERLNYFSDKNLVEMKNKFEKRIDQEIVNIVDKRVDKNTDDFENKIISKVIDRLVPWLKVIIQEEIKINEKEKK